MTRKIKVIQFGLGQIGINIARTILQHGDMFELVGCVDIAAEKIRMDTGEFVEAKGVYDVQFADSVASLKRRKADVVIHSAVSFLPEAAEQVMYLMEHGYNVVTTAEELFFLRRRDPKLFKKMDALAKRKRVRALSAGVNPGYVMDSLVLMLTAPCVSVSTVRVERMVNLGRRRLALRRKLGVGLTSEEFLERAGTGRFGPIGLTDSAEFIAHYLEIKYDDISSTMQPILADHDHNGDDMFVAKNHVVGVRHEVVVDKAGRDIVNLRLTMRVDASIEYDAVFVEGEPPVSVVINNGIMGDIASVGLILNQLRNFLDTPPGFHDMAGMKIPHFGLDHIS
ncbi:MAG: hypothetical protein M1378_12620 [Bacteroidetes bacterium]|nr:hypothetical protein [Bacteroidota bacterium]